MNAMRPQSDSAEPLRHDIRLLGRLLGTVIEECEGKRVFDTIETLRRTAVKFRREGNDADGKLLEQRVKRLQGSDPNSVARAFSYFSHLANIAEDQHGVRLSLADLNIYAFEHRDTTVVLLDGQALKKRLRHRAFPHAGPALPLQRRAHR